LKLKFISLAVDESEEKMLVVAKMWRKEEYIKNMRFTGKGSSVKIAAPSTIAYYITNL